MAKVLVSKVNGPLPLTQPHFVREKGVLKYIPVSRFKLAQMVKNGEFPVPRKLGPRLAVWPSYQIKEYLERNGCTVEEGYLNAVC